MATIEKRINDLEKAINPAGPEPFVLFWHILGSDPPRFTKSINGDRQPGEYSQDDITATKGNCFVVRYADESEENPPND